MSLNTNKIQRKPKQTDQVRQLERSSDAWKSGVPRVFVNRGRIHHTPWDS